MAKKTRRPNIPEATLERARRQMGSALAEPEPHAQETVEPVKTKPLPRPRTQLSSADLRAEYAYVVSDLQNMGVLAGAFLFILIVLAFFL